MPNSRRRAAASTDTSSPPRSEPDVSRRDLAFALVGAGIAAWVYPLCQYLTNQAAGLGMLDIKEIR